VQFIVSVLISQIIFATRLYDRRNKNVPEIEYAESIKFQSVKGNLFKEHPMHVNCIIVLLNFYSFYSFSCSASTHNRATLGG
jgi:hypothetical protein